MSEVCGTLELRTLEQNAEPDFDHLLSGAVESVLETMFFAVPMGPAELETGPGVIEAKLGFHGSPSGTMNVRLSGSTARLLAAGFLGEDEEMLTEAQSGQVVCELVNMLCGSLVSNLETEQSFDLTSPELLPVALQNAQAPTGARAFSQSYELENGILTVSLQLEGTT